MGFKKWIKGGYRDQAEVNLMVLRATGLTSGKAKYDLESGVLRVKDDSITVSEIVDAEFLAGSESSRTTATRVVTGGLVAGAAGAVAGAAARKGTRGPGQLIITTASRRYAFVVPPEGHDAALALVGRLINDSHVS